LKLFDNLARYLIWLSIFFVLYFCYIFLIFPMIEKDFRNEPVTVKSDLWLSTRIDSLSYYYIEKMNHPSVDDYLRSTVDSVRVVNYHKRKTNTTTLKDLDKYIVYFTNNYTSGTLYCYSHYIETGDSNFLKLFWAHVNWMTNNLNYLNNSVATWTNDDMIYDKYNLNFGWASAYAQGFGLSVLCRAYQITKNMKYLILSEKVLSSFNLDYKAGRIMDLDTEGNYWYFEYPAEPPAYVLSGMIFCLFCIYDYHRITGSKKAELYFQRGIQTLEKKLYKYDRGFWSAYDLEYNSYVKLNYHKNVHIQQLEALYLITNDVFNKYSNKFKRYMTEPFKTLFKTIFTLEAIQRRLTYKNPI